MAGPKGPEGDDCNVDVHAADDEEKHGDPALAEAPLGPLCADRGDGDEE